MRPVEGEPAWLIASTSARPKGARPLYGGFFLAATRCSCSDRQRGISTVESLRSRHRSHELSDSLLRRPGTDPASQRELLRSHSVRETAFRYLHRAKAAQS